MRIKDPITLTTTVDALSYDDSSTQAQGIPASMRTQLKEKQVKLRDLLQLNPTIDNPLDELTYSHWIHRVTNICLDAAQMALTAVDTSPGMKYLFAPSYTADSTVRRGDKRNVEGQLLYHTMLLKSPWELPVNYRDQVLDLMAEKDPYLFTRSQPDSHYPYDEWGGEYISSDRQKALQSIQTTKSSDKSLSEEVRTVHLHKSKMLIEAMTREIVARDAALALPGETTASSAAAPAPAPTTLSDEDEYSQIKSLSKDDEIQAILLAYL